MRPSQFFPRPIKVWPNIDWVVIGAALAVSAIGIVTIWGATAVEGRPAAFAGYPRGQLIRVIIGFTAMVVLIVVDYRWSKTFSWILYAGLIAALVFLLVQGRQIKGASSWVTVGGGIRLQPSEFGKVIVAMTLARYLSNRMLNFRKTIHCIVPAAIAGVPMALIFLQPDLGTAVVFLPMTLAMFFVAGIRKRVMIGFAILGVVAAFAGYPHLKPYQKARVQTFLNPGQDELGKGWNIIQAQTALGSGRVFGKGWGRGTQTSFRFLPEFQTDFVFPSFGEQFGFVGCIGVLGLYVLMLGRMTYIAGRTQDLYGALLTSAVVTVLAVHIVLNIGMATGLMPVTGLPLPLFSYGGSFMLTCYMMIGLAVSVGARRET